MKTLSGAGLLAVLAAVGPAAAGPTGGRVTAGTANISSNATTTTVTQTSERAVINWNSFNIGATETVTFAQPNAQSATLNRVTGSQMSSLLGTLNANGQIYLVNPNGVLIGNGAQVNASSFIAATASIADDKFMASAAVASGRYDFNELTAASTAGTIVNAGTITVADGGIAALVAPAVKNTGVIAARLGTIELASATRFTLDLFGDDLVRVAVGDTIGSALTDVQGDAVNAQINAGGTLQADGGKIVLLAVPTATGVVSDAINLSGVARAQSVSAGESGEIHLFAKGRITMSGTADVSASGPGVGGGSVTAIGGDVTVASTGRINASAAGNAGSITLGGVYTSDGETATRTTNVDAGAILRACGTVECALDGTGGAGNGGFVRLYSTNGTRLAGTIEASSSATGNAGQIEVLSNLGLTDVTSTALLTARTGVGGIPGFVVVIGDTLALGGNALYDLRDSADADPVPVNRLIYDVDDPTVTQYILPPDFDEDGLPDNPQFQTSAVALFHAYNPSGQAYEDAMPRKDETLFGGDRLGPVGSLRPNGGVPSSLAAGSAGALIALPVTFTTASLPGSGTDTLNTQVSDTVSRLARESFVEFFGLNVMALPARDTDGPLPLLAGGPGVARTADLGRTGDAAGASPDVFGVNLHVLGPGPEKNDAGVAEYLCKTPYSHNGCQNK